MSSEADTTGNADFVKAAGDVRTLTNVADADLLNLYGLFKQGVHGDNTTEKPGFLDFKGKAKWEAWTKNKGLAKADAQKKYIEFVAQLMAKA